MLTTNLFASSAVETRFGRAPVDIFRAVLSSVPVGTMASVVLDVIDASSAITARAGVTFVDSSLTVAARVTGIRIK